MPSILNPYQTRTLFLKLSLFLFLAGIVSNSSAQHCVFETAAMLYRGDVDEPEKVYRPTEQGSDIEYYVSGDIDASQTKVKSKKITAIHDEYSGQFVLIGSNDTRCSVGSELLSRPEGEEIIVLTKSGELIKGYGAIFPYSESLKIYKDEHRSGSYYQSVSSTEDLVLLINYIDDNPDTKFLVGGKELSKYSGKLYDFLKPAVIHAQLNEVLSQEIMPVVEQVQEENVAKVEVLKEETKIITAEPEAVNVTAKEEIVVPVDSSVENEIVEGTEAVNQQSESKKIDVITTNTASSQPEKTLDQTVDTAYVSIAKTESPQSLISDAPAPLISTKTKVALTDLEKDELMIKAKEKVETLGGCFEVLASTKVSNTFKDENQKIAINLFIHDSVEVAVSSLSRKAYKHFKITAYLKKMRTYNYTDVQISFHNVSKVSNLRKNPDGTYTGIITFSQVFKGFIEGVPVYADRTDKNVEIIIKAREVFAGELQASIAWDVFLGNIGVDQTSPY